MTKLSSEAIFFVYALLDPRKPGPFRYGRWTFSFEPFYIGKGKGDRHKQHYHPSGMSYNQFKARKINSIIRTGLQPLEIVKRANLTEVQAFELECQFIARIGRRSTGGPLTNLTDGGEGGSGRKETLDVLKAKSKRAKQQHKNMTVLEKQLICTKISNSHKNRTPAEIEATRLRCSLAQQRRRASETTEDRKRLSRKMRKAIKNIDSEKKQIKSAKLSAAAYAQHAAMSKSAKKQMYAGIQNAGRETRNARTPQKQAVLNRKQSEATTQWWQNRKKEN